MAFVFEHVKESEADEVLALYRSLVGTPFCAWTADYPARSDVEFDLFRNALFCLRDEETGEIAGVISIDQDPKVESLTCWTPELQPGRELSRLGVRETYQNQGIARKLMAGAMEELALSEGLFVDIGGASTEVVRFAHGQLVSAVSCPVGSLKLYRDWVKKILPNQQAVESMKKAIRQATRGVVEGPVRQGLPLVCVGGPPGRP